MSDGLNLGPGGWRKVGQFVTGVTAPPHGDVNPKGADFGRIVPHTRRMPTDAATRARLRAYQLMEQAQSEAHQGVRDRAGRARGALRRSAPRRKPPSSRPPGSCSTTSCTASDRQAVEFEVEDLMNRAVGLDAPALLPRRSGSGRSWPASRTTAPPCSATPDVRSPWSSTTTCPPLDRCFVWVLCAGAYNTLGPLGARRRALRPRRRARPRVRGAGPAGGRRGQPVPDPAGVDRRALRARQAGRRPRAGTTGLLGRA